MGEKFKWLDCIISKGQFTGEFAVRGKKFDSTDFSLFAPKEVLRFEKEFIKNRHVKGSIRIVSLEQKGDLSLIILPRPAFEDGRIITVKTSQIR